MQDRNAKAPKVRSGDEINPVLGTIVKVASLIVVAALVVLITYIVIELLNKEDKNVNPFTDRIEISVDDFKTIVEGEDFNNLSSNVRDIMIESQEDDNIFFFFYYSNLTNKIDEEIALTVNNRDEDAFIFVVDLYLIVDPEAEGEQVNEIKEYMLSNGHLTELEIATYFNALENGELKYPYFLLLFNEEELNLFNNPFIIVVNDEAILDNVNSLDKQVSEQ